MSRLHTCGSCKSVIARNDRDPKIKIKALNGATRIKRPPNEAPKLICGKCGHSTILIGV